MNFSIGAACENPGAELNRVPPHTQLRLFECGAFAPNVSGTADVLRLMLVRETDFYFLRRFYNE